MESAAIGRRDPTGGETARAAGGIAGGWTPADPGPLGLAAFALTTFLLSAANAGTFGQTGLSAKGPGTVPVVLGVALAYGGIAQLLAGMWEFRTGNTFGAVAFSSFGAFWLSFWAFLQFFAKDITDPKMLNHAVGLFLIAWGIFTAYMFIASLRTTAAIALVFVLLAATFFILGFANYGAHTNGIKVGGWVGIATAVAAWYASFAAVTNSTFARTILPVIPLKREPGAAPAGPAAREATTAERGPGAPS
jgi:succinate-acetate transporter protein